MSGKAQTTNKDVLVYLKENFEKLFEKIDRIEKDVSFLKTEKEKLKIEKESPSKLFENDPLEMFPPDRIKKEKVVKNDITPEYFNPEQFSKGEIING